MDLEETLTELQEKYERGTSLSRALPQMRQLAQAHYEPAVEFFVTGMSDRRIDWRLQCMQLLGFEYDLLGHEIALDGFRHVLVHDREFQLRVRAAEFLALYSSWPDDALIQILNSEHNTQVTFAAFEAALTLAGVPRNNIRDEVAHFFAGRRRPSAQDVENIGQRYENRRNNPFQAWQNPDNKRPSGGQGPETSSGPGGLLWRPGPD